MRLIRLRWLETTSWAWKLRGLIMASVLVGMASGASAAWTAYDDHTRGPGTGANVSTYNLRINGGGGPLTNQATGAVLPAGLRVTSLGSPIAVKSGAPCLAGTPAYGLFNGYVDFYTSSSSDNGSLLYANSNQSITLTFTNLDPSKRYSFRGTCNRAGVDDGTPGNNFHLRWTLCSIIGAASFTEAHSTGCVSATSLPASGLAAGQAAFDGGTNTANGDVVGWDAIAPSAGGSFSIVQTQYLGLIWNGERADPTNDMPGYAINALRLEQMAGPPAIAIISPTNNSVFVQPARLVISAAVSDFPSPVTNVAFYADAMKLGESTNPAASFTWTNPPLGGCQLSATASDSAGNTATSAVVRITVTNRGSVYLVIGSDTAIWNDGTTVDVYSRHPHYPQSFFTDPASPSYQVMDPVWRGKFKDSFGQAIKFTWWLMGGNIYRDADNLNTPVANTMVPYLMKKYHGDAIQQFGDELSLHYHTFLWSDYNQDGIYYWNQSRTFNECRDDFDYTLAQYLLEEEIYPVSFRSGWHFMDNDWQQYLDQLLPYSMHDNWPAVKAWYTVEPINNVQDWSRSSSIFVPFHPATNDYQVAGSIRGWDLRSIKMQSMAQSDMNSIFAKATNGLNQVACIWDHLPEDFVNNFVRIDSYAHLAASNYAGVQFRYCTAVEAMQRWQGTSDQTPPTVDISESVVGQTVTLTIKTSKPLFQPRPFVALRDVFQQYTNLTSLCQPAGTNSWTITLPVPRFQIAKVGLAATDAAGNLATRILRYLPDDLYLDDLDPQYAEVQGNWTPTTNAAWGTSARVALLGSNDTAQARWSLPISRSGLYSLSVQVPPMTNAAGRITFNVYSGDANVYSVFFPSPLSTNQWVYLGAPLLDQTLSNSLEMVVSGTDQPDTWAVADVVRVAPLPEANAPQNSLMIARTPNGFLLRFAGDPGGGCQLQRSSDLKTWSVLATLVVPLDGLLEYEDRNVPAGVAFYRIVLPMP